MRRAGRWGEWQQWLAFLWLSCLLLAALGAEVLPLAFAPDAPDLGAISQPPFSAPHWLGTDPAGRDILAGLVFGARTASFVSVPAAAVATLLGTLLGGMAGYWGNTRFRVPKALAGWLLLVVVVASCVSLQGSELWWLVPGLLGVAGFWPYSTRKRSSWWSVPIDKALLLLIALLTSIPRLILVLAIAAVQQPSLPTLLGVLALTYWPVTAQLARAEMQRTRQLPYIEAARALGLPNGRIIIRHALPTIWRAVGATLPLSVAALVGLETTLSFLGVGLPPQTASWGRMLAAARFDPTAWWLTVLPGLCILFTMLACRQLTFYLSRARE